MTSNVKFLKAIYATQTQARVNMFHCVYAKVEGVGDVPEMLACGNFVSISLGGCWYVVQSTKYQQRAPTISSLWQPQPTPLWMRRERSKKFAPAASTKEAKAIQVGVRRPRHSLIPFNTRERSTPKKMRQAVNDLCDVSFFPQARARVHYIHSRISENVFEHSQN